MWDNPRVLNLAAGALVGIAALVFSLAGITALLRSEFFPVREVQLTRAPQKTSREQIVAAIDGRVGGNIFSASLDDLRASLERLPWVRHVAVRRIWPWRWRSRSTWRSRAGARRMTIRSCTPWLTRSASAFTHAPMPCFRYSSRRRAPRPRWRAATHASRRSLRRWARRRTGLC